MTRIALDLLWLQPGVVGGTETYASRLIGALHGHAAELELHALAPNDAIAAHPDTIGAVRTHGIGSSTGPVRRLVRQHTVLRRALTAIEPDLVHHLGGTLLGHDVPSIVTIHDLQPLDQPETFSKTKVAWLQRAIPASARRAAVVCCPSDWVAEQLVGRFGLRADRVHTVSVPAVVPAADEPPVALSPELQRIAARGPVVLYPAMTLRHKNHRLLFDAFAAAKPTRPELQLVCCGAIGRDHDELVAHARALSDDIHLLGHIESGQLRALYGVAERVVFPSTYEGFGLPVVEAQGAGVPVVASDVTALPSVAGGGAQLLDPTDVDAWADMLRQSPGDRERALVEVGRRNVERFTAEATAAAQLGAYRQALAT